MVNRVFILMVSFFMCIASALAGVVEGKVTDAETGEPLLGASVTYAEGKGISTDIDGLFNLAIPNGKHILTIRYIGYQTTTKEVTVTNSKQYKLKQKRKYEIISVLQVLFHG